MKIIPFDVKYRPEIESGKYKVVTRDQHPVRIVCWDVKQGTEDDDYVPIYALIDYGKLRGEDGKYYMENGRANRHSDVDSRMDLFIVTTDEPDEFETALCQMMYDWEDSEQRADVIAAKWREEVLNAAIPVLAREQEIKCRVSADDEGNKSNKLYTEEDLQNAMKGQYMKGRYEAMGEVPRWKMVKDAVKRVDDEGNHITTEPILVEGWVGKDDYYIVKKDTMVNNRMFCIPVSELRKLPYDDR